MKKFGIILLVAGGVINIIFINAGVGGILRELVRLCILAGLVLFIAGFFTKGKKTS